MNGGRTEMKKQQQPVRSAAVYDGREQIGSVVLARDGRYEARDSRGRLVGHYENLKAAAAALPMLQ
jgi:hypothetical protein